MSLMQHLFIYTLILLSAWSCIHAKPTNGEAATALVIDAAPSVVSYQGSAQTHTRFVIAPMGRSLGYVEPANINRTVNRTERVYVERDYDFLNINPVYVPH